MERYECDKCGACCQGPLIVEVYDIDVLREPHLAAADIGDATRHLAYDALMAKLQSDDGSCIVIAGGQECKFLRGDNTCAIYSTRPNMCVAMQAGDEQCQEARTQQGLLLLEPVRTTRRDTA